MSTTRIDYLAQITMENRSEWARKIYEDVKANIPSVVGDHPPEEIIAIFDIELQRIISRNGHTYVGVFLGLMAVDIETGPPYTMPSVIVLCDVMHACKGEWYARIPKAGKVEIGVAKEDIYELQHGIMELYAFHSAPTLEELKTLYPLDAHKADQFHATIERMLN